MKEIIRTYMILFFIIIFIPFSSKSVDWEYEKIRKLNSPEYLNSSCKKLDDEKKKEFTLLKENFSEDLDNLVIIKNNTIINKDEPVPAGIGYKPHAESRMLERGLWWKIKCEYNPNDLKQNNRLISIAKKKCKTNEVSQIKIALKHHSIFSCSSQHKKELVYKIAKYNDQIQPEKSKKITLGMGSGFWFHSDGYFATNQHVIEGCKNTQVKINNKLIDSQIISFDKINDLAIGKIDKKVGSIFLLSDKPELGEEVMVGGFPLSNVLQNDSIKITRGIVSALSGVNNNYTMLQIDAPIQKGNSGGPIINSYGEVIGVATSYLKSTKEYEAQNVNFGVKVNLLKNMSESIGIDVGKKIKQKIKNTKQLAKALEKNTVHIHCTNTLKEWVAYQNSQNTNAKLSEHIKLNLKDYMK